MLVADILHQTRVEVAGPRVADKQTALRRLAELLATGQPALDAEEIFALLTKREAQQSTGVGGGVAIPHASADGIEGIVGALLLCPKPIAFEAVDGDPVGILFAVVGPRRGVGEHLKTLARVSRLLRDDGFRQRLLAAQSGSEAFSLITQEEGRAA